MAFRRTRAREKPGILDGAAAARDAVAIVIGGRLRQIPMTPGRVFTAPHC